MVTFGKRPANAAPQPTPISSEAEAARFIRDEMDCIPCPVCLAEDTDGRPRSCPYCSGGWVPREMAPAVAAKAEIDFHEEAGAARMRELIGEEGDGDV